MGSHSFRNSPRPSPTPGLPVTPWTPAGATRLAGPVPIPSHPQGYWVDTKGKEKRCPRLPWPLLQLFICGRRCLVPSLVTNALESASSSCDVNASSSFLPNREQKCLLNTSAFSSVSALLTPHVSAALQVGCCCPGASVAFALLDFDLAFLFLAILCTSDCCCPHIAQLTGGRDVPSGMKDCQGATFPPSAEIPFLPCVPPPSCSQIQTSPPAWSRSTSSFSTSGSGSSRP